MFFAEASSSTAAVGAVLGASAVSFGASGVVESEPPQAPMKSTDVANRIVSLIDLMFELL